MNPIPALSPRLAGLGDAHEEALHVLGVRDHEATTYQVQVKMPGFGSEPVPFLGAAIADAAPAADAGRYPLVVLSHGFGMNPEW